MKKVSFGAKRPSQVEPTSVDDWVQDREPTKRLTIDVPVSLHKRIKSQCAVNDLKMADAIRDLLAERFPAVARSEPGEPS